jgi:hypothetical protein
LSFNRTQPRVVVGLLTGHNTPRRHLYVMGLSDNPICRKCGTEEETSVQFFIVAPCILKSKTVHSPTNALFIKLGLKFTQEFT